MRTLVISDLHLGSLTQRDALRRPAALDALATALKDIDRLVLLGDTVELLEGRRRRAMADTEPVLRRLGRALGRGREVVVVPGKHDHALVRPWLRAQAAAGREVGVTARVPVRSSALLAELASWLKPARVSVRYPAITLAPGVFATHGHYLDRHLLPQLPAGLALGPLAPLPKRARPEHYERATGPSMAALQGVMATALPGAVGDPIDRMAGVVRRTALTAGPLAVMTPFAGVLAPLSAALMGMQFLRAGLPAMGLCARRLGVRAEHVIFGHLHRLGPLPPDPPGEWRPGGPGTPRLYNTGAWVYEALLVAGMRPPHPYWPGGAVLVEEGRAPRTLTLLDDLDPDELAP